MDRLSGFVSFWAFRSSRKVFALPPGLDFDMLPGVMKDAHEVLGVAAHASAREIRAAYIARLRTTHPDVGGGGTQSISEIVKAYRSLRYAPLGRRRFEDHESATIRVRPSPRVGQIGLSPSRLSPAGLWGRTASILILLMALGAVFYASSRWPQSYSVLKAAERPAEKLKTSLWVEMEPIDVGVLGDAVADARAFTVHSSARLEQHSRSCFTRLEQKPSVSMLDYCLAFDSAATSLSGGSAPAGDTKEESFFHPGQMSVRHDHALQRLFPDKAAADARHSEVEARATSELIRAMPI